MPESNTAVLEDRETREEEVTAADIAEFFNKGRDQQQRNPHVDPEPNFDKERAQKEYTQVHLYPVKKGGILRRILNWFGRNKLNKKVDHMLKNASYRIAEGADPDEVRTDLERHGLQLVQKEMAEELIDDQMRNGLPVQRHPQTRPMR